MHTRQHRQSTKRQYASQLCLCKLKVELYLLPTTHLQLSKALVSNKEHLQQLVRQTNIVHYCQRWSRRLKARGQGQEHTKHPRSRPRTHVLRTNALNAKDRKARGQDQGSRKQRGCILYKKKVFAQKSRKFSTKFRRSAKKKSKKRFLHKNSQVVRPTPRRNNIAHDLDPFSTNQNCADLEPRAGHSQGLAGFEAKDLTFEAKAKDFKFCPRKLQLCFLPRHIPLALSSNLVSDEIKKAIATTSLKYPKTYFQIDKPKPPKVYEDRTLHGFIIYHELWLYYY